MHSGDVGEELKVSSVKCVLTHCGLREDGIEPPLQGGSYKAWNMRLVTAGDLHLTQ